MNVRGLRIILLLVVATQTGGCLLVRSTEHRIRLNEDRSGDALMRLIDIRSDAETDSTEEGDFTELMSIMGDSALMGFEVPGRTITGRQLLVLGDTLIGEVAYTFNRLEDLEGLRATDEELFVVVGPDREVVGTNGRIERRPEGGARIVWPKDATRLQYRIAERVVRSSISLARRYRARYQ
jgi:hypothetical protein